MRKHVLVLMTTAASLACGTVAASAQTPGAQTNTQSPVTQPIPGGPTMRHQDTQANDDDMVRGASGPILPESPPNLGRMSQREYRDYVRGLGFDATV
jgi:hypothetical protein